jgi:hypothetical protein
MAKDTNLTTYQVRYYSKGEERTDLVSGHNDEHEPESGEYRIWRYMPNNMKVTAFRCRERDWVATAALIHVPPGPVEYGEIERLRAEVDALRERSAMADLRADEMAMRVQVAQREAACAQAEAARLQSDLDEITSSSEPPMADDCPF